MSSSSSSPKHIPKEKKSKNTLKELLPYLSLDSPYAEFGHIAFLDWQQHHNLPLSMSLLLKLKQRGDRFIEYS